MNPTSSYTIPDYPQVRPEQQQQHSLDTTFQNQRSVSTSYNKAPSSKHLLYFSNYCKHSTNLLELLQKDGSIDQVELICIDYRFVKDNITYIKLPNNQSMPLPPMINCVPTLCLTPNYEILTGGKILQYFKPISKNIEEERNHINGEPDPYCLEKETIGNYGVSSDNFSFFDSNEDELSASGNGGMRQLYNYVSVNGNENDSNSESIYTPQDLGKEKKISVSLEQLQQQRQNEL